MSVAAFSKPASVTLRSALLSEAAIGRSAWSLSSRGPRECSASEGDATATLAATATTTSGAAMSRIRLRMVVVSFLWFEPLRARAERQGLDWGVESAVPGGLHGWNFPAARYRPVIALSASGKPGDCA